MKLQTGIDMKDVAFQGGDFDITGALGIFAPAGTPKETAERLAQIQKIVDAAKIRID